MKNTRTLEKIKDALEGIYIVLSEGTGKDAMVAFEINRISEAISDLIEEIEEGY